MLTGYAYQSKSPHPHKVVCGPHPFVRDVLHLCTPWGGGARLQRDKQCQLHDQASVASGPLPHSSVESEDTQRP